MQDAKIFWDKAAQKYAKSKIGDMDAYTTALDRTRSYLSADDEILEVGCGTGSTALLLAGEVRHITASDLSDNMTRIGSEKARDQQILNVTFVTAELFDAVIEKKSYDAVLALNLLHLVEDTSLAIRRIAGLLKPGGLFISKTICPSGPGTPFSFRLIKAILPLMQMIGKAPYVNFMGIKELEQMILSEGFEIIETGNYPASPPNRYIVARKI